MNIAFAGHVHTHFVRRTGIKVVACLVIQAHSHPSVFPPHAHPAETTSPSGERRERRERRRDAPAPQTARSTSVRTRRRQDVRGAARKEMTPSLTDAVDGERGVCGITKVECSKA